MERRSARVTIKQDVAISVGTRPTFTDDELNTSIRAISCPWTSGCIYAPKADMLISDVEEEDICVYIYIEREIDR